MKVFIGNSPINSLFSSAMFDDTGGTGGFSALTLHDHLRILQLGTRLERTRQSGPRLLEEGRCGVRACVPWSFGRSETDGGPVISS